MSEHIRTDEEAIGLIMNGGAPARQRDTAFRFLVEQYQDRIFGVTCKMVGLQDAADLTQDIFMKAFKGIGSFKQESTFSTWIYRIMLNTVTSHRRKMARSAQSRTVDGESYDVNERPAADCPEPADILVNRETIEAVRVALSDLDETEQQIIMLRDFDGRPYCEITELMGLPLGTVKSRLHRARMSLRDKLKGYVQRGDALSADD